MGFLSSFSRLKSILYYVAAIGALSYFGYNFLSDYLASGEAENPKTLTLASIKNKEAKDLPKFFILSNVIRKNENSVESTLEVGKSKTAVSTTETFPVYVPNPKDTGVMFDSKEETKVFVSQPKIEDTTKINVDDFIAAQTYKVKNDYSNVTDEERKIFTESGITVGANAFKLTKGYEIPSASHLWYAIGCFIGALVVLFLLIRSFGQQSA